MDGLALLRTTLIMMIFMLLPLTGKAENHQSSKNQETLCECAYHSEDPIVYIGNGREFRRIEETHKFYSKSYPVFIDENGTKAYLEGMLVLEMKNISDYQSAIPWTMNAKEMTHYYDLGISLITFIDPKDALTAYKVIDAIETPDIVHMELALIEDSIWGSLEHPDHL